MKIINMKNYQSVNENIPTTTDFFHFEQFSNLSPNQSKRFVNFHKRVRDQNTSVNFVLNEIRRAVGIQAPLVQVVTVKLLPYSPLN